VAAASEAVAAAVSEAVDSEAVEAVVAAAALEVVAVVVAVDSEDVVAEEAVDAVGAEVEAVVIRESGSRRPNWADLFETESSRRSPISLCSRSGSKSRRLSISISVTNRIRERSS